jgi:hypothetical protein
MTATRNEAPRSRVYAVVSYAFETMTATRYQHHSVEKPAAGVYCFDCVGMANYVLSLAAPRALAALRAAEHTRPHYVPSPDHFAEYLLALPPSGTAVWRPIGDVDDIEPGDLIVMKKHGRPDGTTFVGHAMFAAATPAPRSDGSRTLDVFDSTGSPHGPDDSRRSDPRAIPKRPDAGPQRVAPAPVLLTHTLHLLDRVHREAPRTFEPQRIAAELVQRQERESVPGGAVAEARSLAQRTGAPDQLTGAERKLHGHQVAERADDPGGAVAPLDVNLLGGPGDRLVERGQLTPATHRRVRTRAPRASFRPSPTSAPTSGAPGSRG